MESKIKPESIEIDCSKPWYSSEKHWLSPKSRLSVKAFASINMLVFEKALLWENKLLFEKNRLFVNALLFVKNWLPVNEFISVKNWLSVKNRLLVNGLLSVKNWLFEKISDCVKKELALNALLFVKAIEEIRSSYQIELEHNTLDDHKSIDKTIQKWDCFHPTHQWNTNY